MNRGEGKQRVSFVNRYHSLGLVMSRSTVNGINKKITPAQNFAPQLPVIGNHSFHFNSTSKPESLTIPGLTYLLILLRYLKVFELLTRL